MGEPIVAAVVLIPIIHDNIDSRFYYESFNVFNHLFSLDQLHFFLEICILISIFLSLFWECSRGYSGIEGLGGGYGVVDHSGGRYVERLLGRSIN